MNAGVVANVTLSSSDNVSNPRKFSIAYAATKDGFIIAVVTEGEIAADSNDFRTITRSRKNGRWPPIFFQWFCMGG